MSPDNTTDTTTENHGVEPVTDQTNHLASTAVQFEDVPTEGVDPSTLPPFKDMARALPADRVGLQARLGAMAKRLPAHLSGGVVNEDELTADDLDQVALMFSSLQDMVLAQAEDREAMTDWLIDQKDPIQAVLTAFSRLQVTLGN